MNNKIDDDRSDAAEQLLTYLAYGKTSREALALFLVEDENVPLELVDTVAWMESMPDPATSSDGESAARDYWKAKVEETKRDVAGIDSAVKLEAVSDLLNEDSITILDEAFYGGE